VTGDMQQQLIRDLVLESMESLDQFERDLLALEDNRADSDTLNRIFRLIHSLKGTSGCLALHKVEQLAHAGENVLSLLREGKLGSSKQLISKLLSFSDGLRKILAEVGETGSEGAADHSHLVADLVALEQSASRGGVVQTTAGSFGLFSDEEPPRGAAPQAQASEGSAVSDSAIRVDVEQLDRIMDLVGELVLARNQIVRFAGNTQDAELLKPTQRLNLITSKLQENIMKTRMQPIGNVWAKYPRLVRDLSLELGKQVSLSMEGAETELDRTILESIKDPLTHLVRNAIDHGLETPAERVARGKPPEGQLKLRALHEGGQVIIQVSDDGQGIDRDKVLRKAVQRSLIGAEEAARMTDREVFALLFQPGFSTSEQVTNVSGRGVGMDVVKRNIERVGGAVDVQSKPGVSTNIRIKIPLTLAIVPALMVRCSGNRYAIPQASLVELVRIGEDQVSSLIEYVEDCPVYRLRGHLLPLVNLRAQLKLPERGQDSGSVFLLVLQAEGRQFGLVVDEILDTEEIVVKPLGKELKSLTVYAGATIMGDGRVALILDVMGIARRVGLLNEHSSGLAFQQAARAAAASASRQSLLLVGVGSGKQAAIPLASVARLEEFAFEALERAGNSDVVQYRGAIMPLVDVVKALGSSAGDAGAASSRRVVVYALEGRNYGLVVENIVDILECEVKLHRTANQPGILGSAVVEKRVTDFLDVAAIVASSGVAEFEAAEFHSEALEKELG
jgi:two-component system, chemotaxis family, sensor kinase CheA